VLDALPERGDTLRIVHAEANGGKGLAIRTGFACARGSIVAIQDADLELDPAELATLAQPIVDGHADVVYGSRFLRGRVRAPWLTLAANRFLTTLTNVLYGAQLTDMETCYKEMRADIARSLDLQANRFDIEPEITAKLLRRGHRIHEIPIRFEPRSRAQGKKIGWGDGVKAIAVLVRHRLR
jgi:glycosyltransferase involved in cell wall biosynthesis